jgi:hypothetical protein
LEGNLWRGPTGRVEGYGLKRFPEKNEGPPGSPSGHPRASKRGGGSEKQVAKQGDFGLNSSVSKLEQVEKQVKRLSITEQEALRDWLEQLLEGRLELKDEFKAEIEASIKDVAEGHYRIRP